MGKITSTDYNFFLLCKMRYYMYIVKAITSHENANKFLNKRGF